MTRLVVDASAWIEYLDGSQKGARIRDLASDEGNEVFTASLSVAEVVSRVQRCGQDGRRTAQNLEAACIIVPMDFTLAVSTGLIHAAMRVKIPDFPYGDAAVLAVARTLKARIVTCDSHFAGERDVILLT